MHLESPDLADRLIEAYRSQALALDAAIENNDRLAGWKLGGNSVEAQALHGVSAPFLGFITREGRHEPGSAIPLGLIPGARCIEVELCLRMGGTLRGSGLTTDDVRAQVAGVSPALEILSIPAQSGRDAASIVAANVFQWGYVLGRETSSPADMDFSQLTASVSKNGVLVHKDAYGARLDGVLESLGWLAEKLDSQNRAVEAGQIVLTGACFGPEPLHIGDAWSAEFEDLGSVRADFT